MELTGHSDRPVTVLRKVGPRMADRLANLGIFTLQDLLFHLPGRYQDRTRVVRICDCRHGDEVAVDVEVVQSEIRFARRRMLLTRVTDGSGFLTLRFFHFSASQQAGLSEGVRLRLFGEIRKTTQGLEMAHPEYRRLQDNNIVETEEYLTPTYPTTDGIGQQTLRSLVDQLFTASGRLTVEVREWLPDAVLQQLHLPSLPNALELAHKPTPDISVDDLNDSRHISQQRLVFEELLAHHLSLRRLREAGKLNSAPALHCKGDLQQQFLQSLPFQLTNAQQRVSQEITDDLMQPHPMQRLIQGDVGSGKTVVAAMAALHTVEAGYQVAIMAPTEILARQHYQNFCQWLLPLSVTVAWLSGKVKGKARENILRDLREGEVRLIVGTQALFQEGVEFQNMGLAIIDEQHRFGVHQRLSLRDKGTTQSPGSANPVRQQYPHQLIMTATPIPRTLAMTAYADLDCSVIDELPPGRTPVDTVVLADSRRDEVTSRVHAVCREGRQAYWVCTLIEESEALQCQTAEDTATHLQQTLGDLRIGLIHGRMKSAEKEAIMAAFKAGETDLLVATTVIEVGVDVPNATLMIIENAERLGLSQLHQLRGRVGRGNQSSACVLMYQPPLSQTARTRLQTMRSTNDGFEVARKDLEIRGQGELLGTRQTGLAQYRIADLLRDQHLLPAVSRVARLLFDQTPTSIQPIINRWIGVNQKYSGV